MKEHTEAISNDMSQLAEDARALLEATADATGDAVAKARKRLSVTLDKGKQVARRIEDETKDKACCAISYVKERPVQSIVVGLSVAAIIGAIFAGRCYRK